MRTQVNGLIENTQTQKKDLDEKLANGKKVLADNGFTDQASVDAMSSNAEKLYSEYNMLNMECSKKSRKVLSALTAVLGIAGLGAAAALGYFNLTAYLPVCGASVAAAVIFFIISLIFRQKDKEYHKMCDSTSAELGALLARHLGDSAVSEDAMNAFRARMGEFSKLCDMVSQSETAIRKFLEDLSNLQTKQAGCSEMIEKQQRTQWELEKKLEHLSNCKNKAKALKRTLAENDRIHDEIVAIDLAQETMADDSGFFRTLSEQRGVPVYHRHHRRDLRQHEHRRESERLPEHEDKARPARKRQQRNHGPGLSRPAPCRRKASHGVRLRIRRFSADLRRQLYPVR